MESRKHAARRPRPPFPRDGSGSTSSISESTFPFSFRKSEITSSTGASVIVPSKTLREMKVSDIKNRVEIGNSSSADAFI